MPEVVGRNPKNEAECGNCGSKLTFQLSEVRAGERIEHDDEGDYTSVITCPTCHRPINVTSKVGRATQQMIRAARERDYDDI